jgi:uncharacterized membrane protein
MSENNNQLDVPVPTIPPSDSLSTIKAELSWHAGPLPSPETVERYELVLPGAFDRILTMAEKDQQDKFTCNREVFELNSTELAIHGRSEFSRNMFAHCGQIFGFVTVIAYFSFLGYSMWIENMTMFTVLFCAGAFAGLSRLVRSYQKKNGEDSTRNRS